MESLGRLLGYQSPWGRIAQGVIDVENNRISNVVYGGTKGRPTNAGGSKGAANFWHSDQMFFEQPS